MSRARFLREIVFPDSLAKPGPSIRAGDFAEILIADYVEYVLDFWVPRGKYSEKASRNESVKGIDIVGFRVISASGNSPQDVLIAFEAKAHLSATPYVKRLQDALDASSEDYLRRATTLHAIKRRLLRDGRPDAAQVIERFQNLADRPYIYRSGAAAVVSDEAFDSTLIQSTTMVSGHSDPTNLELMVVRGADLMRLVHSLYDIAADEA
jgi:hypothetical protein